MKHIEFIKLVTFTLITIIFQSCGEKYPSNDDNHEITVAAYYFPNYHTGDKRNNQLKGEGWSEWELVKNAQPRFKDHQQPKIPAWGYTDEKDPSVMAKKINAASNNGIDCFIFDWYMYEDGPFLNQALDKGFLKAENSEKLKFALMWANHDWVDIHPNKMGEIPKLLYSGKVSPDRYNEISDLLVRDYFTKDNYWKIDGKAYFSIYDIKNFVENFGSLKETKNAMDLLRQKAIKAGLKGVHWNLVSWGNPILPVEKAPSNTEEMVDQLGFDSVTSYVWIHHVNLPKNQTDYQWVQKEYFKYWSETKDELPVPYYPNVTMGWDSSPRCDPDQEWKQTGYPCMNTISNNTPENFRKALEATKKRLLSDPDGPRILNINCWNEWTEGSYLEPDTIHGMDYLEAVNKTFNYETR